MRLFEIRENDYESFYDEMGNDVMYNTYTKKLYIFNIPIYTLNRVFTKIGSIPVGYAETNELMRSLTKPEYFEELDKLYEERNRIISLRNELKSFR